MQKHLTCGMLGGASCLSEYLNAERSTNKFMETPRSEFLAGIKAELPILLGVMPFGMVYGAAALRAGLPALTTQAMSVVVFAGSAQFAIVQLTESAVPMLVIALTACLLNLRHVLYSASLAPFLRHTPPRWRWLLAYLTTDEAYAVVVTHYADTRTAATHKHWFFLGAGLALWVTWQASTAAGILLGAAIPPALSLDFVIPLTFIGLVMPAIRSRASAAVALTAGVMVVLFAVLPFKLGLLAAALVGMIVGVLVEARAEAVAASKEQKEEAE
jgi:4-azaleucine resistance transporter AzlC